MNRLWLTDDPAKAGLPTGSDTVWLHAAGEAVQAERTVSLPEFLKGPREAVRGSKLLVVVGLVTNLCRPANRVKLGQYLTEPWWGPPRISVDTHLFVGDPWRFWWHFGCAGAAYADLHTSYRLESQWKHYVERGGENPCSPEMLLRFGRGVIGFRGGFKFDSFSVATEVVSGDVRDRYAVEKEKAFAEEKTANGIIKRLAKFVQAACPNRNFPADPTQQGNLAVTATDLPVDAFLLDRLRETVELTNAVAGEFAC